MFKTSMLASAAAFARLEGEGRTDEHGNTEVDVKWQQQVADAEDL